MTSYPAGGIVPHFTQGTEFYSHDEAKVLAETYYSIGNDLYQSLLPKLQTQTPSQEDIWRLYPAFVNLSFSCEIILKLFYENDHGKIVSGHKLYKDLFDKLSDDSKKIISDLTINAMKGNSDSDYTNEMFISDLKKSENTFAHERYSFEMIPGKSHGLQCNFLLTFSRMLNILAKSLK